jgi:outer membrane protein OmpA-like peptidoglycan-associated protein
VAEALKVNPQFVKLTIAGHTDNVGSEEFNLQLSQQRADRVRDALVDRGVDGDRLVTRGYGETRPRAPNRTPAGRAQNRRVEFIPFTKRK